jgi:hypothetical protein
MGAKNLVEQRKPTGSGLPDGKNIVRPGLVVSLLSVLLFQRVFLKVMIKSPNLSSWRHRIPALQSLSTRGVVEICDQGLKSYLGRAVRSVMCQR